MALFQIFASKAHLYLSKTRALNLGENIAFITPFSQMFCKIFGQTIEEKDSTQRKNVSF